MEAAARVQLISREIIRPSSETPPHLRKLKLSYLDQLMVPLYTPLLFFYQPDQSKGLTTSIDHTQISQRLKHSLSQTLVSFYPLAGRIQDKFFIECNDEGVAFAEARVHGQRLMDIVEDPHMEELEQYLPVLDNNSMPSPGGAALFHAQVTSFDCGGFTVGMRISHRLADGKSIMAFVSTWAAASRDGEACHVASPSAFDLADYFPPRDFPDHGGQTLKLSVPEEKLVSKRFIFDEEKLAALKRAATSLSKSTVEDPTRVELITAFIWKHFAQASKSKANHTPHHHESKKTTFAAVISVDLRGRKCPSGLLENVFGNCIMLAPALISCGGFEEFHEYVGNLRNAIRKFDDDYITKAQTGDIYLNDYNEMLSMVMRGELEHWCSFTSWSRFPLYEVDYGWGNPVWFSCTEFHLKNVTTLMPSRCGEAIEATITMTQDILDLLEIQINELD